MKLVSLDPSLLVVSQELSRSGSSKQFEDRLRSSIEEIGLAEPLKVALLPTGEYLVVDGAIRLRAIRSIRELNPARFSHIPAYLVDYSRRFEVRYQTDIYQDLLPSQLASLVEHLHETEKVKKADIARYIGVSPTTVRNYTGLWRLLKRGGLFPRIVDLMDAGVLPASNPYAWLRLTSDGLKHVLTTSFSEGKPIEHWIDEQISEAKRGSSFRYPTNFVETATSHLDAKFYRKDEEERSVKRDLGLRRTTAQHLFDLPEATGVVSSAGNSVPTPAAKEAVSRLLEVTHTSSEPVLQSAARSLRKYLQ